MLGGCTAPASDGVWPGESWDTSSPEAEGIDAAAIQSLVDDIESGQYGLVDAFLLIRHGKVVADRRFAHDYASIAAQYDTTNHPYNYDHPEWHPYLRGSDLHALQSVTKSVTSAALGIAIDEGRIDGVDALAMPYFDTYAPFPLDSLKASMTVEDLLTMRSGIQWVTSLPYGTGVHSTDQLEASDEWIRFILDHPNDTTPGTRFQYNDGASVLLGKILREATGQRIDDWAAERLFAPIGITDFYWKITPDGEADTEGGLYLSTHDLARIGYLFLRDGEWDGQQVISREWVETSTAPVVSDVDPDNEGRDPGYGYQWWVPIAEDGVTRVFAGNGYGGQFLFVAPEQDLIAVFNGWNIHGAAERSTWSSFEERILPAVR